MNPTLFAAATPRARSAVAIVRLSGPETARAVTALAGALPEPRVASLRRLRHAGRDIDEALVLWFPAPRSFTGEDAAELQVHGGLAVLDALAQALLDLGLEAAGPGDFTRRALENGRLDLAEAEGLADLIDADTEAQRRQALEQLGGALGRRHEAWRDLLLEASAMLEAAVDFPDEDLPVDVAARAAPPLQALTAAIREALAGPPTGEIIREGYRIALIGAPNAGKSSLLNALAERETAIVTPIPGTTRDVIEAHLVVGGVKVILADTAGLRESSDLVEAEGVRRAQAWARAAHLRLWVVAPDDSLPRPEVVQDDDLLVLSKADLRHQSDPPGLRRLEIVQASVLSTSGLAALRAALAARVTSAVDGAFPAVTRARHRLTLERTATHLQRASANLLHAELAAEDVRLAARALDEIVGRVANEDVLDAVFAGFCIGK